MSRDEIASQQEELAEFVNKMAAKRDKVKDESYFLKCLFYKVHNKYLKNYQNLVTFEELLEQGRYDCVSGTALYVLILEELGFDYSIYESDFHVLLLVQSGEKKIMFESTDFANGFVDDENEIVRRIEYYRSLSEQESDNYYNYQVNTHRMIDSRQLAGLLFYNQAVKEYNNQNFSAANTYLDKAEKLYKGYRITELRDLISKMTIAANSLTLD